MRKEDLGASLKTLSRRVEGHAQGKNAGTPRRHLGGRPGQTDPVSMTQGLKLPLNEGRGVDRRAKSVCRRLGSEKAGWARTLNSYGELGALALAGGADREMRGSLKPTWSLSPSHLTIAGTCLELMECSDSVLNFKCIFHA